MRKMVEMSNRSIKEIENELNGNSSGPAQQNEEMQKYEVLYQKEKEINDFVAKFDEEKNDYEKQISDS